MGAVKSNPIPTARLSDADLTYWRGQFPILSTTTYLVTHSLGAMPWGAREALNRYTEAWASRGVRAWEEGWWDLVSEVGDELAPLVGAPVGTVSLHQNVAVALAVALSCFEFEGERRKVVYADVEFPSVQYQLRELARIGGEPVRVESPDRAYPYEAMIAAIDERTKLAVVSAVVYHSAELVDLVPLAERCREVGVLLVVDAYQAGGTVPLNLVGSGVDLAVGGSVKFLLGGPGVGYLFVRPGLATELRPRLTGWMAHRRPFAFEAGDQDFRGEGSWRFLGGTPHVPALHAARAGYDVIAKVGLPAIRARSLELTGYLIESARSLGWRVVTPSEPERRGGSVTLDLPEADSLVRRLAEREILVDARPRAGVRVGPHFYNTREEVRRFVDAAAAIVKGK